MRKIAVVLGLLCAACGSTASGAAPATDAGGGDDATTDDAGADAAIADAGPDADFGAPSTTYPAFMPRVPQIVAADGGSVMATVRVVPVFFPGDASQTKLVDYLGKLPSSSWWTSVSEYGVGALSVATPVSLASAAPTTIDVAGVGAMVASSLDGSHAEWGPTDATSLATSVYVLFFPPSTSITYPGGGTSCAGTYGFHESVVVGSTRTAFAIVSECTPEPGPTWGGVASHEIAEAATDPLPSTSPAFHDVDGTDFTWELVAHGGEVGDLCAWFKGGFVATPDVGSKVQRVWSNAAMKAFHEPCIPDLSGVPYFASVPRLEDDIAVDVGNGAFTLKGLALKVGESKTVDVDLLSDGPTGGPWKVSVVDAYQAIGGTPSLDLALDRTTGENGNKVHLTVTAKSYPQALGGAAVVDVVSTLGTTTRHWVGGVGITP